MKQLDNPYSTSVNDNSIFKRQKNKIESLSQSGHQQSDSYVNLPQINERDMPIQNLASSKKDNPFSPANRISQNMLGVSKGPALNIKQYQS